MKRIEVRYSGWTPPKDAKLFLAHMFWTPAYGEDSSMVYSFEDCDNQDYYMVPDDVHSLFVSVEEGSLSYFEGTLNIINGVLTIPNTEGETMDEKDLTGLDDTAKIPVEDILVNYAEPENFVKLWLESANKPKIYFGVTSTYEKGSFYCIRTDDGLVDKWPIKKIHKVQENY